MKLFSAKQFHQWDQHTIQAQNITSWQLMERASLSCTNWILDKKFGSPSIKIFCGKGNNGGDGLAIARHLLQNGIIVEVYILEFGAIGSDDFQANLHHLHEHATHIHYIQGEQFFPVIDKSDLIIDALYGTGLNRPLSGLSGSLVEYINQQQPTIISIDLPSGMFADASSRGNNVIMACHTLTLQAMKLCFLLPENEKYTGHITVLDIGLEPSFTENTKTIFELTDKKVASGIYKPRSKFSHKGTYGHCLIIAGSKGKMGAAILSSRACLRSGVGLVTACIPEPSLAIIQTAVPEAMGLTTIELPEADLNMYASIGLGPGLGTGDDVISMVFNVLQNFKKPVVLDADALNIMSINKQGLQLVPKGSILTPHPKEFERLFGKTENNFEQLTKALNIATELRCYIVLKGHHTFIACPDGKGYFNTTGNTGLATGGSGDVLTGIISGLLAQGYSSLHAVLLGVYLHGLAGDIAAKQLSAEAMIAGDIIKAMGKAFKSVAELNN